MNKYEEALTKIKESIKSFHIRCNSEVPKIEKERFELLQELVDKEKPKKPRYEGDGYDRRGIIIYDTWICPNCGKSYEVDFEEYERCPHCGQLIDWSKEDE